MIDPRQALEAVRSELRATVLPELDDDHVRSVAIAMLGILGGVIGQIRFDDAWCEVSSRELHDVIDKWLPALDETTAARVAEYSRDGGNDAPVSSRARALAAAEVLVRAAWEDTVRDPQMLADLRSALAADVDRQVEQSS